MDDHTLSRRGSVDLAAMGTSGTGNRDCRVMAWKLRLPDEAE